MRTGIKLTFLWMLLICTQLVYAGEPLKIWITPPKGKSLKDLHKSDYDWRRDKGRRTDDFQLNDDGQLTANQWSPAAAINNVGVSLVVWEDWRNNNKDVYGQLLDINSSPLGPNFKINDDHGDTDQKDAHVTATIDNGFIVVWRDGRDNNYDIFGQRFAADGQRIRSNYRLNDPNSADQMNPTIKMVPDGTYLVVWEDWRHNNIDIFSQRLSKDGSPIGQSFQINDTYTTTDQTSPMIAFSGQGDGIVVWRDFRNAKSMYDGGDVYAQRLNANQQPIGSNFMINEADNGTIDQCDPQVTMSNRGEMIIIWRDNRNENLDIYGQLYDMNGQKRGTPFIINDDTGTRPQTFPSLSISPTGNFVAFWADRRQGNFDVFAQCFTVTGEKIGANFRVNDDFGAPAMQNESIVVSDQNGNFLFCWTDYRYTEAEHKTDIFAQLSQFSNLMAAAEMKPVTTTRNLTTHQSN